MNEKEIRAVIQKLLERVLNTTYKDPRFVYNTNLLLAVVGKTIGLTKDTADKVFNLIEDAKETGKIDNKKVESIYKAIVETDGGTQFLTAVVDEKIGDAATKLLDMVEIASYKGRHRNLPMDSSNNYISTSLERMDDYLSRRPDGVDGFVPSYQDLSVAISMLENGYIAFQPYRKVVNEFDGKKRINTSQSDLYVQGLEEFVKKNPEYQIFSFTGEIDKFPLTDDMFTQYTKILEYVFADDELIKKFGWKDLLDPAVIQEINKETKNELSKLLEAEQKSGPKIDKFGQGMKNELHKWYQTIPKSWWGEKPKIISGGQSGVDITALEVAKELELLTGGFAPSGYTQKVAGNNVEPYLGERFGLTEIYKSDTGIPGDKADSVEIAKYIKQNATPELLEYFNKIDRLTGKDTLMDFAERWVSSKEVEVSEIAGETKKTIERKLNTVSGNATELAIRSQLNVNAGDINVFFVDPKRINSVGTLKSITYSVTGQWKFPKHISINSTHGKKDMFGNNITGIRVGEDWTVEKVANTLRQQNPEFKAGPDYWETRARKWISNKKNQIGNLHLQLGKGVDYFIEGEEIKSPGKDLQRVQNHTIIVDITNPDITDNLMAAITEIQEAQMGEGKVQIDVNGKPYSVDRISGQSELLEGEAKRLTINVGGHSSITPTQKAHVERVIKAIVSPKGYYDFQNYQIHKHRSTGGTEKKVYDKVNLGIQDYRYESGSDMSKYVHNILGAGTRIDVTAEGLFAEIDLINEGKVTSSVIDENKLLKQFDVQDVKQLVAILKNKPVIKISNYENHPDRIKELYVEVAGFDKLEGYKLKKDNYKEGLKKSLGGDLARLKQKWERNKDTGKFERGQITGMESDKYIADLEHFSSPYSKGDKVIAPRTNWLLNWRVVDNTNPTVKRIEQIKNRFDSIRTMQELKSDYWSRGIDPTPFNYIGKRKAPAEVHYLQAGKKIFVPALMELYKEITSYDLGVRDFDMERIIKDFDIDIYKAETIQEMINALLADPESLTNAVKEVNEVELARARKENLLGKISLFYKMLGTPNALLQAIVLNISKELTSLEYDPQGQRQLVQEAFNELTTVEDLKNLNLEDIFNRAHGSHQQLVAIKTLELFSALHAAELELIQRYPELKKELFRLRAIDVVDRNLDEMMGEDIELYQMTAGPMDSVTRELGMLEGISSEFKELMDSMNESLKGLTKDEIFALNEKIKEFMDLESTKKELAIYESRFHNKKHIIDFANEFGFYNQLSNTSKNNFVKWNINPELSDGEDLNRLLKSAEVYIKKENIPKISPIVVELEKIKAEIKSDKPRIASIKNRLNKFNVEFKQLSNRYGLDYLRIDNDFGLDYDQFTSAGKEKSRSSVARAELYAPGSSPKLEHLYELLMVDDFTMPMAYIFEEGLNNYMSSPDALKAIMLNDLNINPDKKDMFMKLFIQEFGTEVFQPWNFQSSPATLSTLLAEQFYLNPDNLNEILKRLEVVADKAEFSIDNIDEEFVQDLQRQLKLGSKAPIRGQGPDEDIYKISKIISEMFGEFISEADLVKNEQFYLQVMEAAVMQAMQRAISSEENWKKIIDANKAKEGLPNINFKKLVKQMKNSQAYQLLNKVETVSRPQGENVKYIKHTSELRLRGLVNHLNDKLLTGSDFKLKLTSNIPDKWDIKVEQGKQFNPFMVKPAKGSDAFWHIELQKKPKSLGKLDKNVVEALNYILKVEQPTNYVNTTGSYLNADNNILKSGYLNSYLYADSLNDAIEYDYLKKQLQTEYEDTLKNLKILRENTLSKADISDIFQINSTMDYLEMQVNKSYGIIMADILEASRHAGAWKGEKSFYGLTDKGAYPLAKLKLNKKDFTGENMFLLNQSVIPNLIQSKSLDAIEYGQIEKSLQGKMPYELSVYLQSLSDIFEKKDGRHNLDKSIELSNKVFDDLFFNKQSGMLTPADLNVKPINDYIRKVGETQFAYEYYKLQRGEPVPQDFKDLMAEAEAYNKLAKKLKYPHVWDKISGYSGVDATAEEYFRSVYDRYHSIKGDHLKTFIKPGEFDFDKFPELKSYFNMDMSVNFPLKDLPDSLPENFVYLNAQQMRNQSVDELVDKLTNPNKDSELKRFEHISEELRHREKSFLQNYFGINPDQLTLPSGASKEIIVRPKGYWQIAPRPIILGPGDVPGRAIVPDFRFNIPTDLPQVTETFGEGDPFANARWAKRARPVRNPREFITKLINVSKALSTVRYSPAKYEWNVLRTRGSKNSLALIDTPRSDRALPGGPQSRSSRVRNYFRTRVYNARTLREMPFFYTTAQGKGGPRVYPWPWVANLVEPRMDWRGNVKPKGVRKGKIKLTGTRQGSSLGVTPQSEYIYRSNKADFVKHGVGKSYHRAAKAALVADVGHSIIGFYKWNDGTRDYQEIRELTHTLPGRKVIDTIFYPFTFALERPFVIEEKAKKKKELALQELTEGLITQQEYNNKIGRYNLAIGLNTPGKQISNVVGKIWEGLIAGLGDIGNQFKYAAMEADMMNQNYENLNASQWKAQANKDMDTLGKARHVIYNTSDNYYGSLKRFWSRRGIDDDMDDNIIEANTNEEEEADMLEEGELVESTRYNNYLDY